MIIPIGIDTSDRYDYLEGMKYIERNAEILLLRYAALFSAVSVTGPRQSGKSTMLRHVFPDYPYITFDDPSEEFAFSTDPQGFLGRFAGPVIFDEVQRVPELFRYIKMAIDENPEIKGRFLLTGSNQFGFLKDAGETLAGRIGLLSLLPFETGEMPSDFRMRQIWSGSYPGVVQNNGEGLREWYASYFRTYLEKDIRSQFDIGKLSDFQTLVRLLAARTGQEINTASLAKEIGISAKTVDAWISILEAGYIVFRLQPFHANIGKRLIKRSKLYFWDTGLAAYLTGVQSVLLWESGPLKGALFENLVISEFRKRAYHSGSESEFMFYRDNGGSEIDLVVVDRELKKINLMEIKAGSTPKLEWFESINRIEGVLVPVFPDFTFVRQILYRGNTRTDWPKTGTHFIHWLDLA